MMRLRLSRIYSGPNGTPGRLYNADANDAFLCYTLEPPPAGVSHPCIPAGTYTLDLVDSPRFTPVLGHLMLHLVNVPGRSHILIHPGNFVTDTEGCIMPGARLVMGSGVKPDSVQASRAAYAVLYPLASAAIASGGASLEITEEEAIP